MGHCARLWGLFALESIEGRLLWPLGFAYVVALAASLAVALTVTPALCSILLPKARSVMSGVEPWIVSRLKSAYRPVVRWSLDHVGVVIASASVLLIAALASFLFMGRA